MNEVAGVLLTHLRVRARQAFWLLPAIFTIAALALGFGLPRLDPAVADILPLPGDPDSARTFLSSIATSMITMTGLVFSITIVALQLAAGRYSPRIMRDFLRDRVIQCTFGAFVATFVYAMVLQRAISGGSGSANAVVPQLGVSVAFIFVLGSVALFIAYISRIANSMRVANIVARIGARSRVTLDARYPRTVSESHPIPPEGPPDRYVACPHPGVVVAVNNEALTTIAAKADIVITILPHVGDHLAGGEPLLAIHGPGSSDKQLLRHIAFDTERTYEQDVAFGFRELVDIAERGLSPAVNDPTTAAQAIDVLHDLLRRLATRPDPPWCHPGPDGRVRLVTARHHFRDMLAMVVAEIHRYGADDIQVPARLTAMLDDLREVALAEHQDAVMRWRLTVTGR